MAKETYEAVVAWAENLKKRIYKEMEIQGISPYNIKKNFTGNLRKSIGYQIFPKVYNAAGGDPEKITFFYAYYGIFVEKGIMKGQPYNKSKLMNPYREGEKYAAYPPGIREPKPFFFPLIRQREYSLQKILERLTQNQISGLFSYYITKDDTYTPRAWDKDKMNRLNNNK